MKLFNFVLAGGAMIASVSAVEVQSAEDDLLDLLRESVAQEPVDVSGIEEEQQESMDENLDGLLFDSGLGEPVIEEASIEDEPVGPSPNAPGEQATKLQGKNEPSAEAKPNVSAIDRIIDMEEESAEVLEALPEPDIYRKGGAFLVGPKLLEGWTAKPMEGYRYRFEEVVTLADGRDYRFANVPYMLVPSRGALDYDSAVLDALEEIERSSDEMLERLRKILGGRRAGNVVYEGK